MDFSYIQNVLFEMGKFVFISNFILLLIAVMFERKVSSVVISLIVLALASGVMSAATPMLYSWSIKPGILNKFAWYGSFAFVDCMALYLLFKFHKLLKQHVSKVAQVVAGTFLIFTVLQSARFIDRYIFNTDFLSTIYHNAIPALNLVLVPMIIFFWLSERRVKKTVMTEAMQ